MKYIFQIKKKILSIAVVQRFHWLTCGRWEVYLPGGNEFRQTNDGRPMTQVGVEGTKLNMEAIFCYLGDMLCSGGSRDTAVAARCCMASGKCRKLLPVLNLRHFSPKVRGNVYTVCVHSGMLQGSETWDWTLTNKGGSAAMTTTWPAGSVAPNTKKKHPQPHYAGNLALNILQQSFTVGSWDGMVMCSAPRTVSNLSQTYRSQGPDDT